jgi:hypothetical protein
MPTNSVRRKRTKPFLVPALAINQGFFNMYLAKTLCNVRRRGRIKVHYVGRSNLRETTKEASDLSPVVLQKDNKFRDCCNSLKIL